MYKVLKVSTKFTIQSQCENHRCDGCVCVSLSVRVFAAIHLLMLPLNSKLLDVDDRETLSKPECN